MESSGQGFTYSVDLALVIDATGSMSSIIDRVKRHATSFHNDLEKHMTELGKHIDKLRVRAIAYRDYYADPAADSLLSSNFFTLPDQADAFASFVNGISATGGGDEPETGLEAVAEAIRSPWATEGVKQRHVIVVWTDASAHPLEKKAGSKPAGYPADMPKDFDEITDMWEGQTYMGVASKRLLLYSPDAYPWTNMANSWENCIHFASNAGEGLADMHYSEILDMIARSL